MPWALILVVAGLVLVYATSYVTLGWILVAIGGALLLVTGVIFMFIANSARKRFKEFDKQFKSFGRF